MPLPRFDFAPDEWPPLGDGPREGFADAHFETNWNGGRALICARRVGVTGNPNYVLLFFRVEGDATTRLVCDTSGLPCLFEGVQPPQEAIEAALEGGHFGRAQMWECDWLFLHSNGREGNWDGDGTNLYAAPFQLSESAHWECELARPDSDIRFARDWSRLSLHERGRRAAVWTRGSLDELEQFTRAVAVVCRMDRDYVGASWNGSWFSGFGQHKRSDARVRRWNRYLSAHFQWHRDPVLSAARRCVAQSPTGPHIQFPLTPPTAHEQLEAALFLREWAQGKIPPDELRLLLPKL